MSGHNSWLFVRQRWTEISDLSLLTELGAEEDRGLRGGGGTSIMKC